MTTGGLGVARRFARALDGEDYPVAIGLLAPSCLYEIRGDRFIGPVAIVAAYRGNGDDAAQRFDAITYGSDVRREPDSTLVVSFWDRIEHAGRSHEHRCEQVLTVGEDGLIHRIEHRDLPGEVERLAAFKAFVDRESAEGADRGPSNEL